MYGLDAARPRPVYRQFTHDQFICQRYQHDLHREKDRTGRYSGNQQDSIWRAVSKRQEECRQEQLHRDSTYERGYYGIYDEPAPRKVVPVKEQPVYEAYYRKSQSDPGIDRAEREQQCSDGIADGVGCCSPDRTVKHGHDYYRQKIDADADGFGIDADESVENDLQRDHCGNYSDSYSSFCSGHKKTPFKSSAALH